MRGGEGEGGKLKVETAHRSQDKRAEGRRGEPDQERALAVSAEKLLTILLRSECHSRRSQVSLETPIPQEGDCEVAGIEGWRPDLPQGKGLRVCRGAWASGLTEITGKTLGSNRRQVFSVQLCRICGITIGRVLYVA